MIEKVTLRIFWSSAFICANFILAAIWSAPELTEILMKCAVSTFIVGFAAFIVWAPLFAYRFYGKF